MNTLINLAFIAFMVLLVGGVILSIYGWIVKLFKPSDWLTTWRKEHAEYLQTPHWKAYSKAHRIKSGVCQVKGCRVSGWWLLQCHHKHYRSVGHEAQDDCIDLCQKHHNATHRHVLLQLKNGGWLQPFGSE